MRKKVFFGTGIVLLCLGVLGIYSVFRPHHNVEGITPVAEFSAENLYREFQQDENSANKKWVGKVLSVSGVISSVNISGTYVSLNLAGTADGGINCSISKKDLSADIKLVKGDSIIIKGKCTGFLMDVDLVDCVVAK